MSVPTVTETTPFEQLLLKHPVIKSVYPTDAGIVDTQHLEPAPTKPPKYDVYSSSAGSCLRQSRLLNSYQKLQPDARSSLLHYAFPM